MISWRTITDRAKRSDALLRFADRLGRGKGRFRVLDAFSRPPASPVTPDLRDWSTHSIAAAWIGHATVLLRIGGMTILTDPVFSSRVGLGIGLATVGPLRIVAPAVALSRLPKVDLILLSHAHFDHLDVPTLRRMDRRIPVICAEHTSDLIAALRFRDVREMRWGESISAPSVQPLHGDVKITALPVTHWGARTFLDTHRSYNAYLITAGEHRILFAGDTAYQEKFRGIGPVDLFIVGIGAYAPYVAAHATPEQAWAMAEQVKAAAVLPMHHSTFRLSHEPMDEPLRRFIAAAGAAASRIVARQVGGAWNA